MYSNNHLLIKEALQEGVKIYLSAFKDLTGMDDQALQETINKFVTENQLKGESGEKVKEAIRQFLQTNGRDLGSAKEQCIALVAIVAIVVIGLVVALVDWIYVAVEIDVIESASQRGSSSLFLDQLVNEIVLTLE